MSLHDVSKHDDFRLDPKANASDTRAQRDAHGTNSVNYVTDVSSSTSSKLKAGNARLVKASSVSVPVPAGVDGIITTTTAQVAHGLGFAPLAICTMNDSIVNGVPTGYNLALPFIVSAGANTGGTGGAPGYLAVTRWMQYATDSSNLYIIVYTSGASAALDVTYTVTYYLYQQTTF